MHTTDLPRFVNTKEICAVDGELSDLFMHRFDCQIYVALRFHSVQFAKFVPYNSQHPQTPTLEVKDILVVCKFCNIKLY